jgi:NAD-dependent dihydropyrimidine dehydrogenase PreA subunit
MKAMRKIVEIDEDLCNGCGQCLPNCAEGAISIVSGKARIKADKLCDGLGACLGHCPMGALRIIEREAEDFDEDAAHREVAAMEAAAEAHQSGTACGCAGSKVMTFSRPAGHGPRHPPGHGAGLVTGLETDLETGRSAGLGADLTGQSSQGIRAGASNLGHWPVKLRLVPPDAPFLRGAEVVIAADCAPVALPDFNQRLSGKVVMIACPKFDDPEPYRRKLVHMFTHAGIRKVQILRMEVPCCSGLSTLVKQAADMAGTGVPVEDLIVTRTGQAGPAEALAGMKSIF